MASTIKENTDKYDTIEGYNLEQLLIIIKMEYCLQISWKK